MLAVSSTDCSDSRGEAGTNAEDPGDPRGLGAAQQAYCTGHSIVNVVIAPGTYHWEDPLHLLNSAEGFGPRSISLTVTASLSPSSTESSTYTPTDSEISSSVGFDITATFAIDAATTVLVPFGGYARVEAYAAFQMTTWDILGTGCYGAVDTGTGVSFKPVGVYFKTSEVYDCALGGGVVGGGPILSGPVPGSGSSGSGGSTSSGSSSGSGSSGTSSGSTSSGSSSGSGSGGTSGGSTSSGSTGSGGAGGV
jgi:hypothetical protein